MGDFSHLSQKGEAAMVDISAKEPSLRAATVRGLVQVSEACVTAMTTETAKEIARTARLAGIQAAKQTAFLIPLCHQVPLSGVQIEITFEPSERLFAIEAQAKTASATGVEMEAFNAASIAGLTIYDMIKAVDPGAAVGPFQLYAKVGGKLGPWTRDHG